METRANFILIGLFTLLGIIGSLVFFLWLASLQIDRQYAQYAILFENVSGLDPSGDVLFNGVGVGKVTSIAIWEEDPSRVYVGIEIDATTPVRSDTVGQLKSQGVTGVAYIELSGGSPTAPVLEAADGEVPFIKSERSTLQAIVDDAPDLISDASEIMTQLLALTGSDNQARVAQILSNLEESSGKLDGALEDFSQISTTVRKATAQITVFTDRLDDIGGAIETTLSSADTTLDAATRAFNEAETVLKGSNEAIDSAQSAFASADQLMRNEVPHIADQISEAIDTLGTSAKTVLAQISQSTELANARLIALEKTLTEADTAFVAVTETSINIDALISGDGTLLVADARAGLAKLDTSLDALEGIMATDVPVIVDDIQNAVSTANTSITEITSNVTTATEQLAPLLEQAKGALGSVTDTLARSRSTLDGLDSTLVAAETAFDGATTLMAESVDPVMADIRASAARISDAVESVTQNAPAITQDLLSLIARADATVADLQRMVAQSAPGVRSFADNALPQFTLLAQEARNLISSLGNLTRRINDNPTGLILNNRVPEYRK